MKFNLKKVKKEYVFLGLILFFALFLRVYSLGVPPLWIDEGISAVASKNIVEKGIPVLDSGMLHSRAYVFHYIQAGFMLLGQNDFWARFPSVIFGLLTIVLAFFIGREYEGKSGGIISALFMSVFYLEIFFSRQGRMYQLFQLMFFLSLFLLYKSGVDKKNSRKYLIFSLISFFICIDTHLEGLILAPFFIGHILYYNKDKWMSVFPIIPLVNKVFNVSKLPSGSSEMTTNYASRYFDFTSNMRYLLILFVPGVIWSYIKNKRLTLLLVVPSIITLIGVFSLKTIALRYSYFFVFPLVLYSSLLMSYLYERFGKLILISVILLIIFPSNLFFPYNFVTILRPIDSNYNDYSSPYTDYKNVPIELKEKLRENIVVSFFPSDLEWYITKPDYVLKFSFNGLTPDQNSINVTNKKGESVLIDKYAGSPILTKDLIPKLKMNKPYYVIQDSFSFSKIGSESREIFKEITNDCEDVHKSRRGELVILECS